MEKILEKYKKWRGDEDDSWNYDMIHEFFEAVLTRGELCEIIDFLHNNK